MTRGIGVWLATALAVVAAGLGGIALVGCGGAKTDYKYRVAVVPKGLTH
jgi:hypothetical protein